MAGGAGGVGGSPKRYPAIIGQGTLQSLVLDAAADADLWYSYEVARKVGVACIRLATGRNSRASVLPA